MSLASRRSIQNDSNLLADIREFCSRNPEYRYHEPWELQWLLYALNYTNDLASEAEIAAAIEVARTDSDPDEVAK